VGTDISLWQTGVSHPTSIAVHAQVTSHICGGANRRSWGRAGWWANRSLGHAIVSIPAVSIHAHVTNNLSAGAVGWWMRTAWSRADISCGEASGSH